MAKDHGHQHNQGSGDPDWFRFLDIAVWVSVAVMVIMGAEWLFGKIIRESIAAGAARHIKQATATDQPAA